MRGSERTIRLQEVGPRDGLQNEQRALSPEARAKLVELLVDAGLDRIQIGSFVNPRKVPQMAGTDKLWRLLTHRAGIRYSALVLNRKGLDVALSEGIPHVEIYVSASETHSLKNSGASVQDALEDASEMIRVALDSKTGVTAGVMCAFGCFYEGPVPVNKVVEMVRALDYDESLEIGLADTPGLAEPEGIGRVLEAVKETVSVERLAVHLHDTRGFGMANLRTALDMGVRGFDTAIGGLGGCPFIPGARGNISTEQTVITVESLGFRTGANLAKLEQIREDLARMLGRPL